MMNLKQNKARGFTLVELVVVIVIIGILAAVLTSFIRGSTDGAKAVALTRAAEASNSSLSLLAQTCGVSSAVTGNVLPAASKTLSDVLFGGAINVAAAYQTCYTQSNVKPLSESTQVVAAGVYSVQGFTVSFSGGGTSALGVAYAAVPDSVTLLMAQKYSPSLAALAASDLTNTAFQYSTVTAGTRTDTILKQ